jgi:hypothetical protein
MFRIAEYEVSEILKLTTVEESRRFFECNGIEYSVKMNSERYEVFKKSCTCIVCSLEGTKMILERHDETINPHFNLYGEEDSELILFTKDHILPKSRGGKNELSNYNTMCVICNNIKSNFEVTHAQVLEARKGTLGMSLKEKIKRLEQFKKTQKYKI